jgi:hypothetical protein
MYMKATDILKRFEAFLKRYEFAQMKLENGTILEAEEFAAESPVFIVTDDERVPLPIGDYELENGSTLIVADEGVIGSIGEVESAEEKIKEDMKENLEEVKEEVVEETTMGYVSKEELEEAKEELKEMIEEVKAKLEEAKEEVKEEVEAEEEEKEELKAELSKPATEPLTHNPEAEKTVSLKKIGKKRTQLSVMDRIMEKISNIEN